MERTDVAWKYVLRIWWAWAWRTALANGVLLAVFFVVFETLGRGRVRSEAGEFVIVWLVYAGVFLGSFWALWFALSKRYRGFRIVITQESDAGAAKA